MHIFFFPQAGLRVRGSYSFERGASSGRMILHLSPGLFYAVDALPAWFYICLPLVSACLPVVSQYALDALPAWFYICACLRLSPSCLHLPAWFYICLPLVSACLPLLSQCALDALPAWFYICLPLVSACLPPVSQYALDALPAWFYLFVGQLVILLVSKWNGCFPKQVCLWVVLTPLKGVHAWAAWFGVCLRACFPAKDTGFSACFGPHDFALVSYLSPTPLLHPGFSARVISGLTSICLPLVSHYSYRLEVRMSFCDSGYSNILRFACVMLSVQRKNISDIMARGMCEGMPTAKCTVNLLKHTI